MRKRKEKQPRQKSDNSKQTLAGLLKDEITRLARKETKSQVTPIKDASAKYRHELAGVKKQLAVLTKSIAQLQKKMGTMQTAAPAQTETSGKAIRFSAKKMKDHRLKLGLSAADYGKLIGVSSLTVYNWEGEKARPRQRQLAALAAVRRMGKREALALLKTAGGKAAAAPKTRRGKPRKTAKQPATVAPTATAEAVPAATPPAPEA